MTAYNRSSIVIWVEATTAEHYHNLSDDARHIYRHLLVRWLTVGEALWTRRHIHQDVKVKDSARFRQIAGLADPLAEPIESGLLIVFSELYAPTQPFGRNSS